MAKSREAVESRNGANGSYKTLAREFISGFTADRLGRHLIAWDIADELIETTPLLTGIIGQQETWVYVTTVTELPLQQAFETLADLIPDPPSKEARKFLKKWQNRSKTDQDSILADFNAIYQHPKYEVTPETSTRRAEESSNGKRLIVPDSPRGAKRLALKLGIRIQNGTRGGHDRLIAPSGESMGISHHNSGKPLSQGYRGDLGKFLRRNTQAS